jgi:hypothetical protein
VLSYDHRRHLVGGCKPRHTRTLRGALVMTPSGKLSLAFNDENVARLVIGVVGGAAGEEFSLQLRDANGKTLWQPQFTNRY